MYELSSLCSAYFKNREVIGFSVCATKKNNKWNIVIDNCPKKYRKSLERLVIKIITAGEKEIKALTEPEIYEANISHYINVLLEGGINTLCSEIWLHSDLYRMKRQLAELNIVSGVVTLPDSAFELKDYIFNKKLQIDDELAKVS